MGLTAFRNTGARLVRSTAVLGWTSVYYNDKSTYWQKNTPTQVAPGLLLV